MEAMNKQQQQQGKLFGRYSYHEIVFPQFVFNLIVTTQQQRTW
jgi:hypothetical protein